VRSPPYTGREKDLEDEDERVRDVDDLILAARAGELHCERCSVL
jgi:hypothetical protein